MGIYNLGDLFIDSPDLAWQLSKLTDQLSSLQGVIQVLCVSSQPEKRAQTELQIEAGTLRSMCTSAGKRVLRCLRAWMPAA